MGTDGGWNFSLSLVLKILNDCADFICSSKLFQSATADGTRELEYISVHSKTLFWMVTSVPLLG